MPRTYTIPAKPKNDDEFLELLAKILFIMGFKMSIVNERWPLITKAFKNFSIEKVRKLTVEYLVEQEGMIKNKMKIKRILENAEVCHTLIQEHGSIKKWIKTVSKNHEESPIFNPSLEEEIQAQFAGIGKTTRVWVAYVVTKGKSKPHTITR